MLEHLDAKSLFADLNMRSLIDSRLFFVVEGISDVRSLERCINAAECNLISGYGKQDVLHTMHRIQSAKLDISVSLSDRTVGLVDRDFGDWKDENMPDNVFTTDLYDRESDLLLRANLIEDYILAVRDNNKVKQFLDKHESTSVRSVIVSNAAIIGRIRWLSIRDDLQLNLSDFSVGAVMKEPSMMNVDTVINFVLRKSHKDRVDHNTYQKIREAYSEYTTDDEERLCSGHDIISVLAVSSDWWARRKNVGHDELETFLSAAVRCDVLRLLNWFGELESWARDHGRKLWDC